MPEYYNNSRMTKTVNIRRMRIIKITLLFIGFITLTSCASGYKMIEPESINYVLSNESDNVKLEYKYDLLQKRYATKETKKGIKLVALKITNNSDRDLIFGKDLKLTYENGNGIYIMDSNDIYRTLKQNSNSYLLYLILTPMGFYTNDPNGNERIYSIIYLVSVHGLAAGNMLAASSANKKFETEILEYNINGALIEQGKTTYGLIGIQSDSFDPLKLKIE